ncbi:MAG: dTDP-4-dehydrorhamnose reductase [Myxococcales bacterium]|nr:dTDP-4-dehydrorhamnose reductase [Myxococcota bacterium]MDW8280336.1 dTDP-4-dehydrorhamnose reductase [Myxococcales bacterium]
MRVTVVGAGGNLGRHLCEELRAAGHAVDPIERRDVDLSRPDAACRTALRERIAIHQSSVVFNCAAFTDVDGAERQVDLAFLVNALGAELVARAAQEAGAVPCHLSTDFVFDGRQSRPYDEFDRPAPLSVYGRSKLAGEELVQRAVPRSLVVRVEGLFGRGGRNFVSTLVRRLRAGERLRVDRQRRVSPTWCRALARQLVVLAASGETGLYHAVCSGETTWAGFAETACALAEEMGRPLRRTFEAVDSDALPAPAARPQMSVLECRMLRMRGLYQMPPWQTALRDYLLELVRHGEL